jgi:hypothetical protein
MAIRHAARHYTLARKLDKVSYTKGTVPEVYRPIRPERRKGAHQKNKSWE